MISPKHFFDTLVENGVTFFTGVPDSLLKDFCAYVTENAPKENHVISSNEGAAIALAAGCTLVTKKPALVYMQNSGLGNAVNPLLSLADKEVYSVPMLLMIGWRGEPGKKDEPQHVKQGRVMLQMLEAMEIPYSLINAELQDVKGEIEKAVSFATEQNRPYALVVSSGTFDKHTLKEASAFSYPLKREDAIQHILDDISEADVVVSTTGMASREVFEHREKRNQGHRNDFLTVGGMGHCSQIALGIALKHKGKNVYVIDGDGAVIMQMGSLAIIGSEAPENFKHIIINNGAHDSVGGQPTVGFQMDFGAIAKACGYEISLVAESVEEIKAGLQKLKAGKGPSLLEIRVNKGARTDLGRPTSTPVENKEALMEFLST
jgi:phosphonopyruvate decarboxylase